MPRSRKLTWQAGAQEGGEPLMEQSELRTLVTSIWRIVASASLYNECRMLRRLPRTITRFPRDSQENNHRTE